MSLTSRLSLATGQPYDQVANKVTSFRQSLEKRIRGSLNAEKRAFRIHLRLWPSPSLRIHMGMDASPSFSLSSFRSLARFRLDGRTRRRGCRCPLILWVRAPGIFCSLPSLPSLPSSLSQKWRRKQSVLYQLRGRWRRWCEEWPFYPQTQKRYKREGRDGEEGRAPTPKKMFAICDCGGGRGIGEREEEGGGSINLWDRRRAGAWGCWVRAERRG